MKRPIGLPVTRVVESSKKRGHVYVNLGSTLAAFAAGYIHVPKVALGKDRFMLRGLRSAMETSMKVSGE